VLPTDKGNTTVIMNTSDYKKKMKNLLSDKAYKKLDKNPTNTISQNIKILVEKSNIPSKTKSILKSTNSLPPRLYGLSKVHKPNIPLRPIVSAIYFPTYNFSRFLTQTLQSLPGKFESHNQFNELHTKVTKNPIRFTDLLVSFDVEPFFTHKFQ